MAVELSWPFKEIIMAALNAPGFNQLDGVAPA